MKNKKLLRSSLLLISILSTLFCQAQRERDTVRVVILVCDTASTSSSPYETAWRFGYSIRELHNTSEGNIDPGWCANCNWQDYWKDLNIYLQENKVPVPKSWIVWQSVLTK